MEEAGCGPHTVAKNILLSGFCRQQNFLAAERLLAAPGWRPNLVTFNIFMNSLCNAGKIEEAFSQLAVMAAQRITPSSVTVNILLRCICRYSGAEEGKKLLEESWKFGWEVNAVDFNAVMSAFSAAGNWAVAPLLLVRMVKMGVKPDERSFNILIFCLCREGKIQKARRILENGGFKANTVSYNTVIAGFRTTGDVAAAEKLVDRMVEENVEQDLATWTLRIEWLCREKRIGKAKEAFKELKRRFSPDLVVFRVLIGGLVGEGDVAAGKRLVREMVGQGLTPDVATVDSVIRVFCRCGFCGSGEISAIVWEMLRSSASQKFRFN